MSSWRKEGRKKGRGDREGGKKGRKGKKWRWWIYRSLFSMNFAIIRWEKSGSSWRDHGVHGGFVFNLFCFLE